MLDEKVRNPYLDELEEDVLYHFDLTCKDGELTGYGENVENLSEFLGDVKYLCTGGSGNRARNFAGKLEAEYGEKLQVATIGPIGKIERFELYKVGPVLSVSHGMGMPSASIMWNEMVKLLDYAGCHDVQFIRIGTSAGIGVDPGTVVITEQSISEQLKPVYESWKLGEKFEYPADADGSLVAGLQATSGEIKHVVGRTWSTNDFYEGQARRDGALDPGYTKAERDAFLQHLSENLDIKNIEMESLMFLAMCLRAGIPAVVVCTILLDRLVTDQITATGEELAEYSDNAEQLVINYLREELKGLGILEEVS